MENQRSRFCGNVLLIAGLLAAPLHARTFYVDASRGADTRDGLTPQTAWQSLAKVNQSPLQPGDSVLFKRGEVWRGSLVPVSGAEGRPIVYAAYGDGEKPVFLGSVSRNRPEDWQQESPNIWVAGKAPLGAQTRVAEFDSVKWSVHTENGAKVKTSTKSAVGKGPGTMQLDCASSGSSGSHIQLFCVGLPVKADECFLFTFRARCTKPFTVPQTALMRQSAPYGSYSRNHGGPVKVGEQWSEYTLRFLAMTNANNGRITVSLGGSLPAGATFEFQPVSLAHTPAAAAAELSTDVGNIIFDEGKAAGVKRWKQEDLKQLHDYWYDGANWVVKVYAEKNPALLFRSLELALKRHIIDEGGKSWVTYENLALRYGAAHGIGGGTTHHITVRNCDISWIGGAHQNNRPDGKPVRYGNGIEFWSNAHDNLVEGCRVWEIYDAALTNQGDNRNQEYNITYRHNIIWNSEYSFEFWNGKDSAKTGIQESSSRNIRFEYNTCVNAGVCWAHNQRPDVNGRHLMFYSMRAPVFEVYIRNNIFCNATESPLRMDTDWTKSLTMDHNCWFQTGPVLARFLKDSWSAAQFKEYQQKTGMDAHSIVADPKFVNAAALDFRLAPDSPARALSTEGGPVGAR